MKKGTRKKVKMRKKTGKRRGANLKKIKECQKGTKLRQKGKLRSKH
jgi:hypothetical protein